MTPIRIVVCLLPSAALGLTVGGVLRVALPNRPVIRTMVGLALMPAVERAGADAVHRLFYAITIAQPVLGFFTTNAYGFPQRGPTAFLGVIDLPQFMDAAPDLARSLHWAHSIVGWALAALIVAHLAGVLHRHIVHRDGTLLRML